MMKRPSYLLSSAANQLACFLGGTTLHLSCARGWGEQELRGKDGEKGANPDDELSLVTSANAVKLILLGDSAVGKYVPPRS